MATAKGTGQTVEIDGHQLKLTNLDKVLYPATGTTKGEVLHYYAQVAPFLLPYVAERPATRKRWPDGVGDDGEHKLVFFTKNLDSGTPDWVQRRPIEHADRTNYYPLVDDLATLTLMAQLAALELHVPQWKFDQDGNPLPPDRLVLDLDPGPGVDLAACAAVAQMARPLLAGIGLASVPVTSGSKGIHLYARLDGSQTTHQASDLAHEIAKMLEQARPDLITSQMKKSLREGKVFVDWSQNNGNKTTVAPYSLRGRTHPSVAAPRSWDELDDPELAQLGFTEVLERVADLGDLLRPVLGGERGSAPRSDDRLQTYRSMRDASKTPEPVPATAPAPTRGRSFVIQEHHARALHYDFRLERDGVLVSWAVPKNVPTSSKTNHLAVQTEDHPLEYGGFEGNIPRGEYGGGQVSIWDAGRYDLHKWRPGREVIVTLHGRADGGLGSPTTVALIHTGHGDGSRPKQNWLMHRMSEAPDYVEDPPEILNGRPGTEPASFPDEVRPMLATLAAVGDFAAEDAWSYEMKWDGVRVIAYLAGGRAKMITRRDRDVSTTYPEITEALTQIPVRSAILDGEVVALDARGAPSFERLQQRMNLAKPAEVAAMRSSIPVQLCVFDLLEHDGQSFVRRPYLERRAALDALLGTATGRVQAPPGFDGDLNAALDTSATLGLEGVVAKRSDSVYQPGRRGHTWRKIKHHLGQEVVVGGWRPGQGRRNGGVGSLLVGVHEDGELRYAGRVGSGFSAAELDRASERLAELEAATSPFADVPAADAKDAHWVTPVLVGEVHFRGWTSTGRIWQPSWKGWRDDKEPHDVVRET
ncbi:MAG: ATP-dependent DNA ligase [Propionibacteriaceae bacterium]